MNTIEQLRAQIRHLERDIEDKQGEICTAQSNIETFEYEASDLEFDEFVDELTDYELEPIEIAASKNKVVF